MPSPHPRRWWALAALSLSVLAVGLDMTVLNIALPTLATDLDASTGDLQWFANAYNLVLAATLLPAGLLGDRFGRKKMLMVALVLFGLASAGCAYADTTGQLVAARALLGFGGAAILPLCMAVVPVLFDESERGRALGIWVTANALSFPLGPVVGGWLLEHFWWGSVFLINVPIVLIGLLAVATLLPESRSAVRHPVDVLGVVLSATGLVAITYGLIRAGEHGWDDVPAWGAMAAGVAIVVAFVLWQRRARHPLVDLALFRSASFTWGTLLATILTFAMFGLLFGIPQYFQAVLGAGALGVGLRLLPIIGGLMVGARVGQRIVERVGLPGTVAIGFGLFALAVGSGGLTTVDTPYWTLATWLALAGVGMGLTLPQTTNAALGALTVDHSGVGSGLIQAFRQVGGVIGVAVLGSVLNTVYRSTLDTDGLPTPAADAARDSAAQGVAVAHRLDSASLLASVREAYVDAMDVMLWVCAGLAAAGVVFAWAFLPRPSAPTSGTGEVDAAESVETPTASGG